MKNLQKCEKVIHESIMEHSRALNRLADMEQDILDCVALIFETIKSGRKIMICGNGGSAADAQHFAAELIVKFKAVRRAIPALALTTDTSVLTACGNDFNYDYIFARQIEALGCDGDLLLAISTSGSSANILQAIECAKENSMSVLLLTGEKFSGSLRDVLIFKAPHSETARVQEVHQIVYHLICEMLDQLIDDGN